MVQRNIRLEEITHAISFGTTIEVYAHDTPYPSELILCWVGSRPLHVVVATCEPDKVKFIITVYEPDIHRWEDDFKRRKS